MNSKLKQFLTTRFMKVAEDLMQNPQGLKFKVKSALEKLDKQSVKDALGNYVDDFKTLIQMLNMWVNRTYKGVSSKSILYTILAIIYFLTPTDFVPDFIIGLGFIDDIAVLTWVLDLIQNDLNEFKKWQKERAE